MAGFYDESFTALIDFNAIVDQFVGDEVIGIFIPAYPGRTTLVTRSTQHVGCSR